MEERAEMESQAQIRGCVDLYTDEHSEGYLRYSLRDFLKLCNVAKSMEALRRGLEEDRR